MSEGMYIITDFSPDVSVMEIQHKGKVKYICYIGDFCHFVLLKSRIDVAEVTKSLDYFNFKSQEISNQIRKYRYLSDLIDSAISIVQKSRNLIRFNKQRRCYLFCEDSDALYLEYIK